MEDNDTSYDLENLFGTCLEEYNNCYTIGAIHAINDESDYAYDMKSTSLGMLCLMRMTCYRIYLLQLMFVPSLGILCLMK